MSKHNQDWTKPVPPALARTLPTPPAPLIPFGSSFPLPPAGALLGLLLFAPHHRSSVGCLAESVEGAVGDGLACLGGGGGVAPGLLAAVGLVVEVAKEDDEGDGVADEGVVHPVGEVAVDVQGQCRVANGDVELDLEGRERFKIVRASETRHESRSHIRTETIKVEY